jgi:YebC/PmpR family DNA-binding regulatory protein
MAGHSKWANIKHRKGAQDKKRGKVFTKLIREITVAAKLGGSDINANPRLRIATDKARAESVPKDTIDRAVKRGAGELEGVDYEEIRYEGYGPGGAAIMVDCLTDNKNRSVADVRHAFTKFGGNLGSDGSVSFLFTHCGVISFAAGSDEDAIMEAALDAGAEDIVTSDDGFVDVITNVQDFEAVRDALTAAGLGLESADVTMRPSTQTQLDEGQAATMLKMLDAFDEIDDVQEVYTNADISNEILEILRNL